MSDESQSTETSPSSPATKRRRPNPPPARRQGQLSGVQITFAVIVALGLILAINFSTRIANNQLQRDVYQSIENEVAGLELELATLVAERDFVQSDAFVERWARSEGKMARPGEVLVVPVPLEASIQSTPTPPPVVDVDTSRPEPNNWTLWWYLFFDDEPPGS